MKLYKTHHTFFNALTKIVGKTNISQATEDLQLHSKDWSFHTPSLPDMVIWPQTTEQVSKIMQLANQHAIPVTAWGGGSSLEGNPIPVKKGIALDMTRMNNILKLSEDDLHVHVQTGIIGDILNQQLAKKQLFFPAAPGSSYLATVGGMIANNAGGMHAVKYGVVGDWVLELQIVLANGTIIRTGSRSIKSSSGYDLKHLFIGSEGTLGIITEAVLRLTSLPEHKVSMMVSFTKTSEAIKATHDLLTSGCTPAALEYMDKTYMHYVNQAKQTNLAELPTLIIEFHGDKAMNFLQIKKAKALYKENNSVAWSEYKTPKQLALVWQYRRAVRPVLETLFPGMGVLSAEVGLPIGQVGSFLQKAEQVAKKYALPTIIFGHIGEGNFHGWALYERENKKAWEKVNRLNEELIRFAIRVGGTTTGEHGLGIGKRKFLADEHPTALPYMIELKRIFDPNKILNPGKIFLS